VRIGRTKEALDQWFWQEGRAFAKQYVSHHTGWHAVADPFLFSYEEMKAGPGQQFDKFFVHIGMTGVQIPSDFDSAMGFAAQAKVSASKHLRRGIVGEHQEVLSSDIKEELAAELHRASFNEKMLPVLRRWNYDPTILEIRF
ncbi:MAG: hypothetical protein ACLFTP_11230, partial [Rhodosalinus sp.]